MTITLKTTERTKDGDRDAHDRAVHGHIGRRIKAARERAGLSQFDLAQRVGATISRIAKYERGALRLAASELMEIADAVGRPVTFFFQDVRDVGRNGTARPRVEIGASRVRETASLIQAFENISDDAARRDVMRLLREIAANYRLH